MKSKALPPADSPLVLVPEFSLTRRANAAAQPPDPNLARQFHAQLSFSIDVNSSGAGDGGFSFTVGARLLTGGGSFVDVLLEGGGRAPSEDQQQPQRRGAVLTSLRVGVDKRHAGGFTAPTVEGGPVPLAVAAAPPGQEPAAAWVLPEKLMTLDLFVDHSAVEVYAMGGLGRVAARLYPADEASSWGLAVHGAVKAGAGGGATLQSGEVWSMDNAFAGQAPLC